MLGSGGFPTHIVNEFLKCVAASMNAVAERFRKAEQFLCLIVHSWNKWRPKSPRASFLLRGSFCNLVRASDNTGIRLLPCCGMSLPQPAPEFSQWLLPRFNLGFRCDC